MERGRTSETHTHTHSPFLQVLVNDWMRPLFVCVTPEFTAVTVDVRTITTSSTLGPPVCLVKQLGLCIILMLEYSDGCSSLTWRSWSEASMKRRLASHGVGQNNQHVVPRQRLKRRWLIVIWLKPNCYCVVTFCELFFSSSASETCQWRQHAAC